MKYYAACLVAAALSTGNVFAADATGTFRQYCMGCHGKATAMGGISFEKLLGSASVADNFQHWQKVIAVLEAKRMPPPKMKQPSDTDRQDAATWVKAQLKAYADKHAGDPGKVTVRRLTSAEYTYAISDLTGLNLRFDRDFSSDTVGGEGFTNYGDVQFMQDANIERYLEAAKRVANHAVIGAGPLGFYIDPGKSGMELSAVHRIQDIYQTHGFRATAGEGGRPFGLDKYGRAFYAAWRYQHRAALGEPNATLAGIAKDENLMPRFVEHIWSVTQQPNPRFPTSEVISKFRALPSPDKADAKAVQAACDDIQKFVVDWPRFLFAAGALAAGGQGDERALLITDAAIQASANHTFRFGLRQGATRTPKVYLTAATLNPGAKDKPEILWKNPTVRVRTADRAFGEPQPLRSVLSEAQAAKLKFNEAGEFTTTVGDPVEIEITPSNSAGGVLLQAEAVVPAGSDNVLRVTISDKPEVSKGRPVWALLADPKSSGFEQWKAAVLSFAANLPQNSHAEPTPADKDEIPAPFNNTYNQPERDRFHAKLKYYRIDDFIVDKMLDDPTRRKLDDAWADLLSSFEYHDEFLNFVAGKYKLDLGKKEIADLTPADIAAIPAEPRQYVKALRAEYDSVMKMEGASQQRHVSDCLELASQAWRRPLTTAEKTGLRAFYKQAITIHKLDHERAIRALITRILMAPSFLYRLEPAKLAGVRPLNNQEMASRLSFFLWSSIPDAELQRAAVAGELTKVDGIESQVKRMLEDPKARRFATEFFGQWLGFYRFDQFTGVDTKRFPEFTDEVKAAMYEEAVSFFDYVVRKDRPVREMFFADYTFLNQPLAKHYGVSKELASKTDFQRVDSAGEFHRGGMLRLGAVLTATSAPLRTSPVKRGDWVLRRILGTPTPPPPADAGSIPADEKAFGGLSVRERLEVHKRNATCAGCHTRIDPLGFPMEKYDSIGRWRTQYSDGKPIDDGADLGDTPIAGVGGLLKYLDVKQEQVLHNMTSKLLGYALGRTVLASDQSLIESMVQPGGDTTFVKLISRIATSKQFRYRREQEDTATPAKQQTSVRPQAASKEGGL